VLLGYDMQRGPKGQEHWHAEHPSPSRPDYKNWLHRFSTLVEPLSGAGVSIWNCSRATALECFPRRPLRDVLPESSEVAA
jgi:hypothetical protein